MDTYYNFLRLHQARNELHRRYHDWLPSCVQVHALLQALLQLIKFVSSSSKLSSELNIIEYSIDFSIFSLSFYIMAQLIHLLMKASLVEYKILSIVKIGQF